MIIRKQPCGAPAILNKRLVQCLTSPVITDPAVMLDIAQQEAKTRQRADFSDQRLLFAFAEVTENLFLQTVPNHWSGVFRQKRYRPLE